MVHIWQKINIVLYCKSYWVIEDGFKREKFPEFPCLTFNGLYKRTHKRTITTTSTRSQICLFNEFNDESSSFARFARAFVIFVHFAAVLVLSTTLNGLLCSCVDKVNTCQVDYFESSAMQNEYFPGPGCSKAD